jgi:hypothetical protein
MSLVSTNSESSLKSNANFGLLGLFSILAGTMLAADFVPDQVEEAGALFVPAVCITLGLLTAPILRVRRDLTAVLRVENALMAAIVYWVLLDLLQSAYPLYGLSKSYVVTAFWAIGVFAAGIWLGAAGRGWRLPGTVQKAALCSISNGTLFSAIGISFCLGMFDFAFWSGFNPFVMIKGAMMDRWAAPWARGQFGDAYAVFDHLTYFGYTLPALCVLLAHRVGWLNSRVLVSIGLAAVMLVFLSQSGGRRIIGVTVGAALVTYFVCQRQLSFKLVIGGGATVTLLLIFLEEMLRYRNVGFGAWLAGETPEFDASHFHVDDNFLRLSQIIRIFPDLHAYVLYQPIYHALTLPIPRVLWPGKPSDPGFDLPQLIGLRGASLSSSIVGELYASLGLAAVFAGGLVMGRFAGMWNKILSLRGGTAQPLIFGLGVMVLFAGMRSLQALVQMSYIVLGWLVVSRFLSGGGIPDRVEGQIQVRS